MGHGPAGIEWAAISKLKSVPELPRMAWFAKRKSAGQSKWRLFRWPLELAAPETSGRRGLGKRRAHRVDLHAPVFLYGSMTGEPFFECSETIEVSIHGALVAVHARLFPAQRILLTNLQTQQDLKCRVVRIDNNRSAAALEFLEPCPRFWCIDFATTST
jgi:hypothetical protein